MGPTGRGCEGADAEARVFRSSCADVIRQMDEHLRDTAGTRELYVVFVRKRTATNALGWGHALPAAIALHWLCWRAGRYCRIELFDHDLGRYWGYANGASWRKPGNAEWGDEVRSWRTSNRSMWRARHGQGATAQELHDMVHRLRASTAARLKLVFDGGLTVGSHEWLERLPLRNASGGLDRCFARYVTEPRFLEQGSRSVDAPRTALQNGSDAAN